MTKTQAIDQLLERLEKIEANIAKALKEKNTNEYNIQLARRNEIFNALELIDEINEL